MSTQTYLILVLVFLAGNYLLDLVSRVLNLRALSPEPPAEFRDVLDAEKYRCAQEYIRVGLRFGAARATVHFTLTLLFLLLGGFPWADRLAHAVGGGPIVTGLLFLGICALLAHLADLPFTIWETFWIEQQYGFNRTTWRTFMLDEIKGLVLAALLGGGIAAAVLWFFGAAGPLAWLYAWVAVVAVQVVVLFVAPVLIMPLFNKYTPLPEGDLKRTLEDYIHGQRFRMRGLFTMDGSRRSTHSNAFFTGFGRFRRIVLYDTLIEKHTVRELLAVVAHEMGHYRKFHVPVSILLSIAMLGVIFALLPVFLHNDALAAAFGLPHATVYAGLVCFSFLFTPIQVILGVLTSALSRRFEYQADRYAAVTTGDGEALVAALKRLCADNHSHLTPHPFVVVLSYSHPPVLARIRALRSGGR